MRFTSEQFFFSGIRISLVFVLPIPGNFFLIAVSRCSVVGFMPGPPHPGRLANELLFEKPICVRRLSCPSTRLCHAALF